MTIDRGILIRALRRKAGFFERINGQNETEILLRQAAGALESALSAVPIEGEVEWEYGPTKLWRRTPAIPAGPWEEVEDERPE